MTTTPTGDETEWTSAEDDTRLLAAYCEAVSRLQKYVETQARDAARRYGDQRRASTHVDEVVQETVRRYLGLSEKLRTVKRPRAYVAAIVRRLLTRAMRFHAAPIDALAEARTGECELLEDRDLLLDAAAVVEGWIRQHPVGGRDLLTELRRQSECPGRDYASMMALLAERAGLGERVARQDLALLVRDLSVRVGDPSRPARWHLQRQDRGYLRALAALMRSLVTRADRADLADVRRHERLAAAAGTRVRCQDGGAKEHVGELANVSERGLAVVFPGHEGNCPCIRNASGNGRKATFEVIPPGSSEADVRTLSGDVVRTDPSTLGVTCRVHLQEPIEPELLRSLSDGTAGVGDEV